MHVTIYILGWLIIASRLHRRRKTCGRRLAAGEDGRYATRYSLRYQRRRPAVRGNVHALADALQHHFSRFWPPWPVRGRDLEFRVMHCAI